MSHAFPARLLFMIGCCFGLQFAMAQTLPLNANYTQAARLAPDATTAALSFNVDAKASTIVIDIASPLDTLTTSVQLPGGGTITETSVTGLGGSFAKVDGRISSGALIYPFTGGGYHYVYTLPKQGNGNYVVQVVAPAGVSAETAVTVQVHTNSAIATNLVFPEPNVVTGQPAAIAAAVFDGTTPVAGANVLVRVLTPSGIVATFNLLDDGGSADGVAGDGLYSGLFTPPAPGTYLAVAEVSGVAGGVPFARQAGASLTAVRATATLGPTLVARGIDLNANGELDRIAFDATANVTVTGKYRLFVYISSNGKTLTGSGDATLAAAAQQPISASFATSDLTAKGLGNGPYTVGQMDLVFIDGSTAIPSDRKIDLGTYGNFVNSPFESAALALTGSTSDSAIDTNGNGLYDQLRVQVQINAKIAGVYQFSGRLADATGSQIALYASTASLAAGANTITFLFDGATIGRSGKSGPYIVDSLLIFGAGVSLSVPSAIATTQPYTYTQFEAATRSQADLDNNGLVNCADVAIVKASYGKRTGQSGFDARADINSNGLVDINDLTIVTRALPIGITCP